MYLWTSNKYKIPFFVHPMQSIVIKPLYSRTGYDCISLLLTVSVIDSGGHFCFQCLIIDGLIAGLVTLDYHPSKR